ncbi:hypothetical protein [Agromyces sp. LHK192]|uniref:hypothetical protein n=1 Tax=Agromyces sp. LHK192 TaxID=2498704 RepID=UPI000FDBEB6D|nr:hypothetical protein [Agromyces sp. LHK192]
MSELSSTVVAPATAPVPATAPLTLRESDRAIAAAATAAVFDRTQRPRRVRLALGQPLALLAWATGLGVAGALAWFVTH